MTFFSGELKSYGKFWKTEFNVDFNLSNFFHGEGEDYFGKFTIKGRKKNNKIVFLKNYELCKGFNFPHGMEIESKACFKYSGTIEEDVIKGIWFNTGYLTIRSKGVFWLSEKKIDDAEKIRNSLDDSLCSWENIGLKEGDKLTYVYFEGLGIHPREADCVLKKQNGEFVAHQKKYTPFEGKSFPFDYYLTQGIFKLNKNLKNLLF